MSYMSRYMSLPSNRERVNQKRRENYAKNPKVRLGMKRRSQKLFTQNGGAYWSYKCARDRCRNRSHSNYHNYGGRGIEFRFKNFNEFLSELGPRPASKTLDRIRVNGHYEVGNVRWSTAEQQSQNKRRR